MMSMIPPRSEYLQLPHTPRPTGRGGRPGVDESGAVQPRVCGPTEGPRRSP